MSAPATLFHPSLDLFIHVTLAELSPHREDTLFRLFGGQSWFNNRNPSTYRHRQQLECIHTQVVTHTSVSR